MRIVLLLGVLSVFVVAFPGPADAQRAVRFDDAHVHLNEPEAWIRLMDEAGILRAVVFRGRRADNESLTRAAARWPGRLLPFVSVSPEHREYRGLWMEDDPALAQIADSLLSTGAFFGIGEISVSHFPGAGFPEADFAPDGEIMRALLTVARRHGVPVSVHSEVTRLREFEALLDAFPDVPVIWAHGGYVPLFLAERLLRRHPNLTYELSARTWRSHPRSPEYTILSDGRAVWPDWIALIEAMPDRFLVGTDASLRSESSDRAKIRSVQDFLAQLSPAAGARVGQDNLADLVPAMK